jgi:hypothetical protein
VSEQDNISFLDLMEDYFNQTETDLKKDTRPELSYQVGVTLEHTERPKCAVDDPCLKIIESLEPSERPLDISAHSPDPKCRFFWKMGDKPPYETQFPALNAANVVPSADFLKHRWESTMSQWGDAMKTAYVNFLFFIFEFCKINLIQRVADLGDMVAIGLDLPVETFRQAGRYGFVSVHCVV